MSDINTKLSSIEKALDVQENMLDEVYKLRKRDRLGKFILGLLALLIVAVGVFGTVTFGNTVTNADTLERIEQEVLQRDYNDCIASNEFRMFRQNELDEEVRIDLEETDQLRNQPPFVAESLPGYAEGGAAVQQILEFIEDATARDRAEALVISEDELIVSQQAVASHLSQYPLQDCGPDPTAGGN